MKIRHSFTHPAADQPGQTHLTPGAVRQQGAAGAPPAEAAGHTPAPEVIQYQDLVRQQPEVRADLLVRAARRLAAGDYLTPAAAEQTAEALLRDEH